MSTSKPDFILKRIENHDGDHPPEIYSLTGPPQSGGITRRRLLGAGLQVGSVLCALRPQDGAAQAPGTPQTTQGKPADTVFAHVENVNTLAMSSDGKRLVSGSDDMTIKVWLLPDGTLEQVVKSNDKKVDIVIPLAGSNNAATLADDGQIDLWDLGGGGWLRTLAEPMGSFRGGTMAATPDGKMLITDVRKKNSTRRGNFFALRSALDGKIIRHISLRHNGDIDVTAVSPDGTLLATSSIHYNIIHIWNLPGGTLKLSLNEHPKYLRTVAIAPDSVTVAGGFSDGSILLYSLPKRKPVIKLSAHASSVSALAITPDGGTLVSVSYDRTIKLWSLPDGVLRQTLNSPGSGLQSVAISPDGKTMATGDMRGTICLWNLPGGDFRTFAFDPAANRKDGNTYRRVDATTGVTLTYTMPCGTPLPPGAVCVCNCVPGTYVPTLAANKPPPATTGRTTTSWTCICIPVFLPR